MLKLRLYIHRYNSLPCSRTKYKKKNRVIAFKPANNLLTRTKTGFDLILVKMQPEASASSHSLFGNQNF
ncbi:hypothetical protein AXX17_AT2G23270 [Arabidopsis thaliana]|uniref:Uncharacterized protein n=1 Tax=Arabidopsis thaliana TaxID=3702 RepID=A0A178VPM0_ARATH|nr:hypothetical protein AXX17_AT2G23270 [Arabidopsis thaliana]